MVIMILNSTRRRGWYWKGVSTAITGEWRYISTMFTAELQSRRKVIADLSLTLLTPERRILDISALKLSGHLGGKKVLFSLRALRSDIITFSIAAAMSTAQERIGVDCLQIHLQRNIRRI
eukprot:PhM_4_TR11647/c3_g1_i2/m.68122